VDKLTIFGMGLIGSSLGMALKKAQIKAEIVAFDRDRAVSSSARRAGACDKVETNPIDAVKGSSMVILSIPMGAMPEVMEFLGPELDDGCIVTDTGSSKAAVLGWADQYLPQTVSFVGGHPMAGKEVSGPEGADPNLYLGATYCIIPSKNAGERAVDEVVSLVEAIGAKPYFIDALEHDSFVAAVSHLPMVLSSALVKLTSGDPSWPEISRLASSGYRDVTRLASGNPELNRDMCLTNKDSLVHWIDEYVKELSEFKELIKSGNDADIVRVFDDIWEARDRLMQSKVTAPSASPPVEVPSTAETMGGMVVGDRAAGRIREILDWFKDDKRKRR